MVGASCRLPGGLDSSQSLWRCLIEGQDVVQGGDPGNRWDNYFLPVPSGTEDSRLLRVGGYLKNIAEFDPAFFGIAPKEAACIDPQHRLLLEVTWEALENAGIPPRQLDGSQTGVFTGLSQTSYRDLIDPGENDIYHATGIVLSGASGRISYVLGTRGPSVTVEAACASSLVSIHLACQSLLTGESALALAGGVNINLDWRTTIGFTRAGMLSPQGRCHAFDSRADGFVRSEGSGMVVLKRLSDAERDGDRILAIVRGSAVNHVGHSQGLMMPSAIAQKQVLRTALTRAGVEPGQVGLVETHGTGTPVGDPIEFEAVASLYGTGPGRCALGAVKTNVGHTESASGVIGFIKTVMALQEGVIPPNLHFQRWNPQISAQGTRLFVPIRVEPWPVRGESRFAAVSAFGVTGSNAHLVLEQAHRPTPSPRVPTPPQRQAQERVFTLSAGSPAALRGSAARIASWLASDGMDSPLGDIAHTLAVRRSHALHRAAVLARSREELAAGLHALAEGTPGRHAVTGRVEAASQPVWVFSGYGSQWEGMGRTLLDQEPEFTRVINALEPIAAREAGISLRQLITSALPMNRMDVVQPLLYALQVALAATWHSHGVRPSAVVGHSVGEVAAAAAAGMLTLEQGMAVTCIRSRLLQRMAGGAMAVVGLSEEQVAEDLAREGRAGVSVAVVASPTSTVISGDVQGVKHLLDHWAARGHFVSPVAVQVAAHSPQVEPVLGELALALAELRPSPPQVPFYSTALDSPRAEAVCDARYWVTNLRSPVRFSRAIEALLTDGHELFVEISPHALLTASIEETATAMGRGARVLPTLLRERPERTSFLTHLAALHCAGGRVDWSTMYPAGALANIPATVWERRPYWPQKPTTPVLPRSSAHPLLGIQIQVPDQDTEEGVRYVWKGDVGTLPNPWLGDHRVRDVPVLPGAAYIEMAIAAACEVFHCAPDQVRVTNVELQQLLLLTEHVEVCTVAVPHCGKMRFEVLTRGTAGTWVCHARAELAHATNEALETGAEREDLAAVHGADGHDAGSLYRRLRTLGLNYGPAFNGLSRLVAGTLPAQSRWGQVSIPEAARLRQGRVWLHPALLDSCLHALATLVLEEAGGESEDSPWLPTSVARIQLSGDPSKIRWCRAWIDASKDGAITGRLHLLDPAGIRVGVLEGIQLIRMKPQQPVEALRDRLFQTAWEEVPLPRAERTSPPGRWLVLAEDGGEHFAKGLIEALAVHGAQGALLSGNEAGLAASITQHLSAAGASAPYQGLVFCAPLPSKGNAPPLIDPLEGLERISQVAGLVRAHAEGHTLPRLWLITHGARPVLPEDPVRPDQAALQGLARILNYEHPELRTTLIDADPSAGPWQLAEELLAGRSEDEVAWRGGVRRVARLVSSPLRHDERLQPQPIALRYGRDGFLLEDDGSGTMEGLRFVARERQPPRKDEVEVQVRVASLNFRDVMIALGILPSDDRARLSLGADCAGVVTAVGSGVQHLRPGDRVMAMAGGEQGTFSSFCLLPAHCAVRLPEGLTLEDAATLPATYATAWYGLRRLARLAPGESVLIHSAAGGVGLAALAIARARGARILATAGDENKRTHLREMGIEHVMDSRSLDFAAEVRQLTAGRGVDVILNSLAGDALRAGLEILAPNGRFIEIGKRDLYGNSKVGLRVFRHGITFSSIDMKLLEPKIMQEMLREVLDEVSSGRLPPLPYRLFPFTQASEAFRIMASGKHIGRLMFTLPERGEHPVQPTPGSSRAVRAGGSYVIAGGLRGLGLETARWLVSHKAGRVVLNGRSAPSGETLAIVEQLRSQGTEIDVVLGDISLPGTAQRLVAAACAGGQALRGVIHAAVVLDDAPVAHLDPDRINRVWQPKVAGAWNLHQATLGHDLDWWVAFSSQTSLVGNAGQGNYAAANSWLDAFAAWRRRQGLPALAINWGAWGEAGRAQDFKARGFTTIGTREGMTALEALLIHNRTSTGMFAFEPHMWFRSFPQAAASPFFARLLDKMPQEAHALETEDTAPLEAIWAAPPGLRRQHLLQSHLVTQLGVVTGLQAATISPDIAFTLQGLDSLMAVQLRNLVRASLGVELPINAVWTHPTPAKLATYLDGMLGQDTQNPGGQS
ncbi:type I polyketide synthase [Stigmatella sp. ncwal1]|uniref:Type I polyketide synthase n=1 Tax=Stigmatella ashevillensis TaxID=2995309 RepID=A0ABT5D4N7_9BACT|nr:type I polyketide synthase [Stigmatella ashevillena]MDC0708622.1 type I polyketide synthase [Stigmatella ashevillena]